MDPNELLKIIECTDLRSKQIEACENLFDWLSKGGFKPDWLKYEYSTRLFQEWCIDTHGKDPLNFNPIYLTSPNKVPKSDTLSPGIDQIPFEGIEAIGAIFAEGEAKYGKDNWKQQPNNEVYNQERTRHAIRHLMLWANGDRSEPHLAKVAWFCITTIWREKQCTG